ncbi:MAG: hypothetical protein LC778_20195 [Acidobacteria bacterium]|nr:hypothetical protein [Acidobacteriota bacterium]MCA1628132.1 hypothetical protein [Acidobacteriota bacterium]
MTVDERLRVTSCRVRDYLAAEHDEFYPLLVVERAVSKWFELEVERLLEDSAEILTTPRYVQAQALQSQLARTAQENKRQADDCFSPVDITGLISTNEREMYARELSV